MSCSVHDVVRLEARGIPTCAVGTEPFRDEALEQAGALGMPQLRLAFVAHPVQILTRDGVRALADGVVDDVVAWLREQPDAEPA